MEDSRRGGPLRGDRPPPDLEWVSLEVEALDAAFREMVIAGLREQVPIRHLNPGTEAVPSARIQACASMEELRALGEAMSRNLEEIRVALEVMACALVLESFRQQLSALFRSARQVNLVTVSGSVKLEASRE